MRAIDKPLTSCPDDDEILTRALESMLPNKGSPDPPTASETREALNCHPDGGGVHLNFDASEILSATDVFLF